MHVRIQLAGQGGLQSVVESDHLRPRSHGEAGENAFRRIRHQIGRVAAAAFVQCEVLRQFGATPSRRGNSSRTLGRYVSA